MKRKKDNYLKVLEYLRSHSCVDCEETDLVVLTFDHVRGVKKTEIHNLLCSTWDTVEEEIQKCDVRCFNCHARRTAAQQNWTKLCDYKF